MNYDVTTLLVSQSFKELDRQQDKLKKLGFSNQQAEEYRQGIYIKKTVDFSNNNLLKVEEEFKQNGIPYSLYYIDWVSPPSYRSRYKGFALVDNQEKIHSFSPSIIYSLTKSASDSFKAEKGLIKNEP